MKDVTVGFGLGLVAAVSGWVAYQLYFGDKELEPEPEPVTGPMTGNYVYEIGIPWTAGDSQERIDWLERKLNVKAKAIGSGTSQSKPFGWGDGKYTVYRFRAPKDAFRKGQLIDFNLFKTSIRSKKKAA